ncbi:hypothetical protein [Pseudonocardia xinjiangensis]|uniref:Uncharacterized protein n=1 Tax=Pseudonocardia xinjiangensis TaxID=75289 RepID=A0ABX1RE84_9PSEU|nr:hypothetical protein [Pseudonocardia xinjiangensis]NMH77435.1 hypothetical protein [Pseudonocardia xinjiangensis]
MKPASVEAQLRTRAFARVLGPYIATVTAVLAIRLPEMMGLATNLFAEPVLAGMLGALMLGGGLVIIGGHRSWRGPLAMTVSLFGWFVALRGLLLLATPTVIRSGVEATALSPTATTLARVFFGALAVVGLLLTYAGWFTEPVEARPAVPPTTASVA